MSQRNQFGFLFYFFFFWRGGGFFLRKQLKNMAKEGKKYPKLGNFFHSIIPLFQIVLFRMLNLQFSLTENIALKGRGFINRFDCVKRTSPRWMRINDVIYSILRARKTFVFAYHILSQQISQSFHTFDFRVLVDGSRFEEKSLQRLRSTVEFYTSSFL